MNHDWNYLLLWPHIVPIVEEHDQCDASWSLAEFDLIREYIRHSRSKVLPELLLHESLHAIIHFGGIGTPDPTHLKVGTVAQILANGLLNTTVVLQERPKKLTQFFDRLFVKAKSQGTVESKICNRYFTFVYDPDMEDDIYKIQATQEWIIISVNAQCSRPEIWWMSGFLEHVSYMWWIYTRDKKEKFQEEQFVRVMTQAILPYVERHFTF